MQHLDEDVLPVLPPLARAVYCHLSVDLVENPDAKPGGDATEDDVNVRDSLRRLWAVLFAGAADSAAFAPGGPPGLALPADSCSSSSALFAALTASVSLISRPFPTGQGVPRCGIRACKRRPLNALQTRKNPRSHGASAGASDFRLLWARTFRSNVLDRSAR